MADSDVYSSLAFSKAQVSFNLFTTYKQALV